jgi:hypothetical protein
MKNIVNIVTEMIVNTIIESTSIDEASGFDTIFDQLKLKLKDISILPDNVIDVSKYKEHEIIDSLKSIGYEYKKPMSGKLHFFNKKTSISLYLIQNELKITLMP